MATAGASVRPTPGAAARASGVIAADGVLGEVTIPALAIGISSLILVAVVVAQLVTGVAILPAVRRVLGSLGIRRLPGPG